MKQFKKQFNLEAAKNGKPVCTNIGEPVEIIKYDYHGECPIVAIVNQRERQVARLYNLDGKHRYRDDFLMMASVKHEGWVNVYKSNDSHEDLDSFALYQMQQGIFKTKDEALGAVKKSIKYSTYIATVYIEWEE